MSEGFEEADLRAGLRAGGRILSAFIVARPGPAWNRNGYVAYLRTTWRRGYHILQTRRKRSEKVYRGGGLARLLWQLRVEFKFADPATVYEAGCQDLQRFTDLRPVDRGRAARTPKPRRASLREPAREQPPAGSPPADAGGEPRRAGEPRDD